MKIIIIGANGTIGKKITTDLEDKHEIIKVGRNRGDIQADFTNVESLEEMFFEVGEFDALVCAAGSGHFGEGNGFSGFRERLEK